jgi:hypothetical protein
MESIEEERLEDSSRSLPSISSIHTGAGHVLNYRVFRRYLRQDWPTRQPRAQFNGRMIVPFQFFLFQFDPISTMPLHVHIRLIRPVEHSLSAAIARANFAGS